MNGNMQMSKVEGEILVVHLEYLVGKGWPLYTLVVPTSVILCRRLISMTDFGSPTSYGEAIPILTTKLSVA